MPSDLYHLPPRLVGKVTTREPQYSQCFEAAPVTLGPMTGWSYQRDPKHLGFVLAHYKFVAAMLSGCPRVAEIGPADGFPSHVVKQAVGQLDLFDFDPVWVAECERRHPGRAKLWDITDGPLWKVSDGKFYDAVFACDVIEHIWPENEPRAMRNICDSLTDNGVFIFGCPSLESQQYASAIAKAGHVNCKTGDRLKADALAYFRNVFLFCMNDEALYVGKPQMARYLFALCTGPIRS
jgi:hypothetical protein